MPDIFLSYTREDQATAQRFAEGFEAQGITVWWDATLRSGEAYDTVTEEALKTAKAVVVLWSKRSVVSRWVRAEATLADRNRTLVPARIEACDLPIMFELTQTADLSHWKGEVHDPAWRAFFIDVRRFIETAGAAERPAPGASVKAAASPPAHSTSPSIAVLPFINRSGRVENDVFADGMVEDLTAALSLSPWMKVVAASATAIYRKGTKDLRQIGRDLGVRYLLEGNVRQVGDDLRVTAQLVEAESGGILWTQKFDRPLAEVSALQDDLVTEVAAHLGVQVQRVEVEHALQAPGDGGVRGAMLRVQSHLYDPTRSRWEAAIAEGRRAIEINPNDGVAYAQLAAWQGQLLHERGGDDPELAQELVDNIRRARALEPNNPAVLGRIAGALVGLRKLDDALALAERFVALTPRNDPAHYVLGSILARLGRSDEAIAELDAAERLAPNSIWAYRAAIFRSVAHLRAGRPDQALEAAERFIRLQPSTELLIQSMLCSAILNARNRAHDASRALRDMDPEISWAQIENLIRDYYDGSNAVEEHVAIARRLWDETSIEPGSP
jgi:TolB-like protein